MEIMGTDRIMNALTNLRESQSAVEDAIMEFNEHDLTKENAKLRGTLEDLNAQLSESRAETANLQNEYNTLEKNFKHELSSKRTTALGMSEQRHQAYLFTGLEREQRRVAELYAWLQKTEQDMTKQLYDLDVEERQPLLKEVADLGARINEQVEQANKRKEAAWLMAANHHSNAMSDLKAMPIENAALNAVRKFFAWETFLGLKIISAIGALLLLLGVFTFGRFLYVNIGPVLQSILIFVLGIALMVGGEVFHRKKWRGGFTLALTAAGSGMLFLGAALGYMTIGVLPMWLALAICAGAALLTFAVSLKYNAQLIAIFALIGGYLPLIALTEAIVLFGAIYFMVFNLLAVLIATRKNWRVTRFIGLGAGLITQLVLMNISIAKMEYVTDVSVIVTVGIYIAIGFLTYLVIPVFGAWFTKTNIKIADVVLLSCNIFFSFLVGLWWGARYAAASISLWQDHTGIVSAMITSVFAISCIVMALLAERRKHSGVPESEAGSMRALFFITSITFSALVVLFAFDSVWFSAGWLVQATGLALYGIFKDRCRFKIAGLVIGAFCLMAFLFANVPNHNDPLFVWQYLSITLLAVVVSLATLRNESKRRDIKICLNIFRAAALLNLWGYMVYGLFDQLTPLFNQWFDGNARDFAAVLSITFGFALAFVIPRIKNVYNHGFQIAAIILGVASTVWLIIFNAGAHGLLHGGATMSIIVFSLYIIVNITAVGWINDLLRFMGGLNKLPIGWYPLLISGGAMLLITQNLVVQLSLNASSLILTLIFGLAALGWVLYGFAKRNSVMRIAGLSMAFFAIIKLLMLDLHGLSTMWRIISYFSGGLVLLTISFTYQWFNKRLNDEEKASSTDDTEH